MLFIQLFVLYLLKLKNYIMNLYDRLIDKERLKKLGAVSPKSYERTIEVLKSQTTIHDLTLFEAAEMYWLIHPEQTFDMTKFFHFFELAN